MKKKRQSLRNLEAVPRYRSEFVSRLKQLMAGKNAAAVAKQIGVPSSTFYTWLNGTSEPDMQTVARLARELGGTYQWLAAGALPMAPGGEADPHFVTIQNAERAIRETAPLRLHRDWLEKSLPAGIVAADLFAFVMPDDSMEKTLRRGDLLIFEFRSPRVGTKEPPENGIYVIDLEPRRDAPPVRYTFRPLVRRFQWMVGGKRKGLGAIIYCDNNANYPERLSYANVRELPSILGRVLWRLGPP